MHITWLRTRISITGRLHVQAKCTRVHMVKYMPRMHICVKYTRQKTDRAAWSITPYTIGCPVVIQATVRQLLCSWPFSWHSSSRRYFHEHVGIILLYVMCSVILSHVHPRIRRRCVCLPFSGHICVYFTSFSRLNCVLDYASNLNARTSSWHINI